MDVILRDATPEMWGIELGGALGARIDEAIGYKAQEKMNINETENERFSEYSIFAPQTNALVDENQVFKTCCLVVPSSLFRFEYGFSLSIDALLPSFFDI